MSTNYLVTQPGPVCAGPASPTPHLAWGVYSGAVLSGLVAGQQAALQIDSMGNLLVNVAVGGGSSSNASVGLTGTTAPTSATELGIIDLSGNLQGVSASNPLPVSEALIGQTAESTAAWTSATAQNTTLAINVVGYSTVAITLQQGSTITQGAITFEVSDTALGTNWYPVSVVSTNGNVVGNGYNLVASTNIAFQMNVAGFVQFRIRLSLAISGTATVNIGVTAQASAAEWEQFIFNTISTPVFTELLDGSGNIIGTATHPIRIDPTGTTVQPVNGTVTAEIVGNAGAILDGTAGSPSTGVLTVQGTAGGTPIPVSISGSSAAGLPVIIEGQTPGNNGVVVPQLVKTDPTTNDLLKLMIGEMKAMRIVLSHLASEDGTARFNDFDPTVWVDTDENFLS